MTILSQETDKRPMWIRNNTVRLGEFEYRGITIPYSIMNKDLEPRLPGFLGFFDGYLVISEEVQDSYRRPQLIHEYVEYTKSNDKPGRCVAALKHELKFVSEEIRSEYLRYRRDYFGRLIEYYRDLRKDADELREIRNGYDYLCKLGAS